MTRPAYCAFDAKGSVFTTGGTGDAITFAIDRVDDGRTLTFTILDAEIAVDVAHDLLERVFPSVADCEELEAAVTALRALATRSARLDAIAMGAH